MAACRVARANPRRITPQRSRRAYSTGAAKHSGSLPLIATNFGARKTCRAGDIDRMRNTVVQDGDMNTLVLLTRVRECVMHSHRSRPARREA